MTNHTRIKPAIRKKGLAIIEEVIKNPGSAKYCSQAVVNLRAFAVQNGLMKQGEIPATPLLIGHVRDWIKKNRVRVVFVYDDPRYNDPHYRYWFENTDHINYKRAISNLEICQKKPAPLHWCSHCRWRIASKGQQRCGSCTKLSSDVPASIMRPPRPTISQDEWVRYLSEDYAEPVELEGTIIYVVLKFRTIFGLDPVSQSQYEQDDRIVLLETPSGRIAKHCLVVDDEMERIIAVHAFADRYNRRKLGFP